MEDTWRENQEYALRQTRICFVVMGLVYIVEGLSGLGKGRRKPDK